MVFIAKQNDGRQSCFVRIQLQESFIANIKISDSTLPPRPQILQKLFGILWRVLVKQRTEMFDFISKTLGAGKRAPHTNCTLKTRSSRELRKFSGDD